MKKSVDFRKIKSLFLATIFTLGGTGCGDVHETPPAKVPDSWYRLPEDGGVEFSEENTESAGKLVDSVLETTGAALEEAEGPEEYTFDLLTTTKAPDEVPWRLTHLITDLTVSASGVLGSLLLKGSPSVTLVWKKKEPQVHFASDEMERRSDLIVSERTTATEMATQLEPIVQMAVASGHVRSATVLRRNLLAAARDFHAMAQGLSADRRRGWYPSRFRMDLAVDASGNVGSVSLGGDLRLRFDWFRMMTKSSGRPSAGNLSPKARELREFVKTMTASLAATSDSFENLHGFEATSFRTGIGVGVKGTVGLVKAGGSITGHVYFTRDSSKTKSRALLAMDEAVPSSIALIESAPKAEHLRFAANHGIAFEKVADTAVYRVEQRKLQTGLHKAARMAGFFARRAANMRDGRWKIQELKTGFDMSLSGTVGLIGVTGVATVEITFKNKNF